MSVRKLIITRKKLKTDSFIFEQLCIKIEMHAECEN